MADLFFHSLEFGYEPKGPSLLRVEELSIEQGSRVSLVGANGSGKTTIAKLISGIFLPRSGAMLIGETPTSELKPRELAAKVGYIFQNPNHQLFAPTVEKELRFGLENLKLSADVVEDRLRTVVDQFGLAPVLELEPHSLNRSMKRRISIAVVIAMAPSVVIFDEPTNGMDFSATRELLELIDGLSKRDVTTVVISHDSLFLTEFGERSLLVADGTLRETTVTELLKDGTVLIPGYGFSLAQKLGESWKNAWDFPELQRRGEQKP